jgi:hypothetical protein
MCTKWKSKAVNVITEIEKNGKNFLVGISLNPEIEGKSLNINSIRSIFPKNSTEWLNWITQGKSLYLNKGEIKIQIEQQRTNLADVPYLDLHNATKVIQVFENPKKLEGKSEKKYEKAVVEARASAPVAQHRWRQGLS